VAGDMNPRLAQRGDGLPADLLRMIHGLGGVAQPHAGGGLGERNLEAARRLNAEPSRCVDVEDSTNGLRSAEAAEMTTIAIPNRRFPPAEKALEQATLVIDSIEQLRPERLDRLTLAQS
jgi:hypothetical protein